MFEAQYKLLTIRKLKNIRMDQGWYEKRKGILF